MANSEVILLERVDNLGAMGDVVSVKPGYARNFLLPQGKALRANKENLAYFEAQRKALEGESAKKKTEAEKLAKKIDGAKAPLIRQASESGQLFGSVNSRDIAAEISATTGEKIDRTQVVINTNFKTIGLFPVDVVLHPEVKVVVTINIARSPEEAEIQAETGRALIADDNETIEEVVEQQAEAVEEQLAEALEEDALEAEKARQAEEAEKEAEEAAKAEAKAAKKAEKEAAAAAEAEAEEADAADADATEEEKAE